MWNGRIGQFLVIANTFWWKNFRNIYVYFSSEFSLSNITYFFKNSIYNATNTTRCLNRNYYTALLKCKCFSFLVAKFYLWFFINKTFCLLFQHCSEFLPRTSLSFYPINRAASLLNKYLFMFYLRQGRHNQKGKCHRDSQTDTAAPGSIKKVSSGHHPVNSSPLDFTLRSQFHISRGFIQICIRDLLFHYNNGLSRRQSNMAAQ